MDLKLLSLGVLSTFLSLTSAQDCPLLGPAFPAPQGLGDSSSWESTLSDLQSQLDTYVADPAQITNTSFSLNVFSAYQDGPLFEYHYESPALNGSIPEGRKLDGDTVYRVASISKLLTVYITLIEAGFDALEEPVTKYLPELLNLETGDDDTATIQFSQMTLGSLVNHMSGLARDYSSDFASSTSMDDNVELGFPRLEPADVPPCGLEQFNLTACTREQLFQLLAAQDPVVQPFSTPVYSNEGYDLLGLSLEKMQGGASFNEMATRSMFKLLNLTRTSLEKPDDALGIIPGDPITTNWNASMGSRDYAGGFFSSTNDLARIGQSILRNTLLSPSDTKRWMKPITHTSSLTSSVGMPWEIFRLTEPRVTDLYTKSGGMGSYGSLLILSPDHQIGFSILAAGQYHGPQSFKLGDLLTEQLIPAVENEARKETISNFSGTYSSDGDGENDSGDDRDSNSNNTNIITISKNDDGRAGLAVDDWILNGVDFKATWRYVHTVPDTTEISVRLYPTSNPETTSNSRIAFRAVFEIVQDDKDDSKKQGVFTGPCNSWMTVGVLLYGSRSVDEFVFDLDEKGRAVALDMRAWRKTLDKTK